MEIVVEEGYKYDKETLLTVMKTSLFFSGDGFSIYDSDAHILFRVDSYGGPATRSQRELVLMAPDGRCLLTVRRKWRSFHRRWEGYAGEFKDGAKPTFSVRRSSMMGLGSVTVEMNDSRREFQIEGSFMQRSCTLYDAGTGVVVAEIRRKVDSCPCADVVLGKDVFLLCVKAGFDCAFATALVLVLDQICGADEEDGIGDDGLVESSTDSGCENPATMGAMNMATEEVELCDFY